MVLLSMAALVGVTLFLCSNTNKKYITGRAPKVIVKDPGSVLSVKIIKTLCVYFPFIGEASNMMIILECVLS